MGKRNEFTPGMNSFVNDFFGITSLMIKDIINGEDNINENYKNSSIINTNFFEDDSMYEISFSLPGYNKNDLDISIDNGILYIHSNILDDDIRYIKKQINSIRFTKKITLPEDIFIETISAKMVDGILNIKIEKLKKNDITSKKINIE